MRALAEQVKELKETINVLVSQVQLLRSEVVLYHKSINHS